MVFAVAGDALAHADSFHYPAYVFDHAGRAVAERHRSVQPVHHLAIGGEPAFLTEIAHHLAEALRALAGFFPQAGARQLPLRSLGAGTDERVGIAHQHVHRPQGRHRRFFHAQHTCTVALYQLFHCIAGGLHTLPPAVAQV